MLKRLYVVMCLYVRSVFFWTFSILKRDGLANALTIVSILIAISSFMFGINKYSENQKLEQERTILDDENQQLVKENTLLHRNARHLDLSKTVAAQTDSFGGDQIVVTGDDLASRRPKGKVEEVISPNRLLHSIDLTAVYAVDTHAKVHVSDLSKTVNEEKEEELLRQTELLRQFVLPFIFSKSSSVVPSVRGSALIAASKLFRDTHRAEMRKKSTENSLSRFGKTFAESNFDRIEFRADGILNFHNLVFDRSSFKEADFSEPKFDEASLFKVDFSKAYFRDATFIKATSTGEILDDTWSINFDNAKFLGAKCNFASAIMHKAQLTNAEFKNACSFKSAIMNGTDFSNTKFEAGCDFTLAEMPGVIFDSVVFDDTCKFVSCKMQGASFKLSEIKGKEKFVNIEPGTNEIQPDANGCNFEKTKFHGATLENVKIKNANFNRVEFITNQVNQVTGKPKPCTLTNVNFIDTELSESKFQGCQLDQCEFIDECNLTGSRFDLLGTTLTGIDFGTRGKDENSYKSFILDNSYFKDAILKRVNFFGGSAKNTDFRDVKFEETICFKKTNLKLANFSRAKFNGDITFSGAHLWGADFRDCALQKVSFDDAKLHWTLIPYDDENYSPNSFATSIEENSSVPVDKYNWNLVPVGEKNYKDKGPAVLLKRSAKVKDVWPGTYDIVGLIYRVDAGGVLQMIKTSTPVLITELNKLDHTQLGALFFTGIDEKEKEEIDEALRVTEETQRNEKFKELIKTFIAHSPNEEDAKKKYDEKKKKDLETLRIVMKTSRWKINLP